MMRLWHHLETDDAMTHPRLVGASAASTPPLGPADRWPPPTQGLAGLWFDDAAPPPRRPSDAPVGRAAHPQIARGTVAGLAAYWRGERIRASTPDAGRCTAPRSSARCGDALLPDPARHARRRYGEIARRVGRPVRGARARRRGRSAATSVCGRRAVPPRRRQPAAR
ncbi:MAG: hypothetical protein MZW92_57000 [Comamonadaceae bacterium]|nr:hypothetical protein [Comamonadaceae bacterium]